MKYLASFTVIFLFSALSHGQSPECHAAYIYPVIETKVGVNQEQAYSIAEAVLHQQGYILDGDNYKSQTQSCFIEIVWDGSSLKMVPYTTEMAEYTAEDFIDDILPRLEALVVARELGNYLRVTEEIVLQE